jgi:hypothetical protein
MNNVLNFLDIDNKKTQIPTLINKNPSMHMHLLIFQALDLYVEQPTPLIHWAQFNN